MGIIETQRYARAPFYVDAVQVTPENMQNVADWCNGEVKSLEKDEGEGTDYIKVQVRRADGDDQTMAFAGRWVLKAGSGFKVYTDKAFKKGFILDSDASIIHDTDNRSAKTGRYVSNEEAKANPDTTVQERTTKKRRRTPVPTEPKRRKDHLTSSVGDSVTPEMQAELNNLQGQ